MNPTDAKPLPQPVLIAPPERRAPRHLPLWIVIGLILLAAGAQLSTRWHLPFPQCLLRKLTGIPCPTCGCTRSLVAWSELDLAAAFQFNPLFSLLCVGLLGWFGLWCVEWVTGRVWLHRWSAQLRRGPVWKVFIALAVVNWVYLWLKLPK